MKNKIASISLGLVSITTCIGTLVGCGGGKHTSIPEARQVHQAPTREEETGVVVSGVSEDEVAKLLESNAEFSVRVINANHQLYEVFGGTVDEVKTQIQNPNALVEKNKYIKLNRFAAEKIFPVAPTAKNPLVQAIEENLQLQLDGAVLDFANTCKLSSFLAPRIEITDNQSRDRQNTSIFYELGQTLVLDASKSNPVIGPKGTLTFMWILKAPEDSSLKPTAVGAPTLSYQADATGMYLFALVAKDSSGNCGLDIRPFYVTANDSFNPQNALPDSMSDSLDVNAFWHVIYVGSREVWKTAVGAGITVGIIDSGVDYNHPALSSNIKVNTGEIPNNKIDDDMNGFVDDYAGYDFGQDDSSPYDDYGHGTHVAGIAASNVFGAARKSLILPTKFGAGLGFDIASVTGAIKYSVDQGAKVLNMSFGWEEDLVVMREAMRYAEERDVLVVAAAGNETENNDIKPLFPSSYNNRNIISVAATDENDRLTFYSNFGQRVHIAAPGGTLSRPIISSYKKNPLNEDYKGLMGTSMASPLVAGVAAQVWSANPGLTALQVKEILLRTGKSAPALQGKILTGKVVDAKAALAQVLATGPESRPQAESLLIK